MYVCFFLTQVAEGTLTAGQLGAFVLYSLVLGFQTSALATIYSDLQRAVGASERLLALADRVSSMPVQKDSMEEKPQPCVVVQSDKALESIGSYSAWSRGESNGLDIEFVNVKFTYPTRLEAGPVIQCLNLRLRAGEIVGVSGESGCGKSTLLRLLSRLYDADEGIFVVLI